MQKKHNLDLSIFEISSEKIEFPIIKKVKGFADLADGWNYGDGHKFEDNVIKASIDFCYYLYDNLFSDLEAYPGLNGEILIKIYFQTSSLEVFINKDLVCNFLVENRNGDELFQSPDISITDLKKQILSQRLNEWNLFVYYPSHITIKDLKDSTASHSKTPQLSSGSVSRSLEQRAQLKQIRQYVNTLEQSIQNIQTLQFTGSSIQEHSLLPLD